MRLRQYHDGVGGASRLDFFVDLNLWHAPSTDAADIILPVAHWIELNSPRASQGSAGAMGATVKCVQPPAEALYDPEIVMNVDERMGCRGPNDPDNEWPDIQWQLDDSIKLLSDDEYSYQDWTVENGKVVNVRAEGHAPRRAEAEVHLGRLRAEFQDNGWWQAKDVEPEDVGHLPSLPDRRHPRP
ncbi:MAG: hypothetical protein V8S24_04455 [Gordonibacter pamelaeae]